ncbi:MAG: AraC family transcriptional regulator [Proteobacteria bacterium]|nr:AraC family transcriptional regulator [Pseudomonadota bacterium]
MSQPDVLDCSLQPPTERASYWEDGVQRLMACHVKAEPLERGQPLVSLLEKLELGELTLFSIRGSAQRAWLQPPSSFRGLMLMTPLADGGWLADEAQTPIRAGHAYLLDPQRPWVMNLTRAFEHRVLMLPDSLARSARNLLAGAAQAVMPLQGCGELFGHLLGAAFAQAKARSLSASSMATVARTLVDLLDAAIGDAGASSARTHARLAAFHRRQIREYALGRLHDPELDVHAIARAVRLSVRYVHHLFSAEDQSLMRWIWSRRLERCLQQLQAGAGSGLHVSDVAYAWGFRDPNHFSRLFRQAYGSSPSAVATRTPVRRDDNGDSA